MSSTEASAGDKVKFTMKGSSKFIIIAIVIAALAVEFVLSPPLGVEYYGHAGMISTLGRGWPENLRNQAHPYGPAINSSY